MPLTSDDTRPVVEGQPPPPSQVYRFDAQTGQLVRISVGRDGFNDDGNLGGAANQGAAIVEAHDGSERAAGPARADLTMSDDGQYVFFESPVALAPGALDDVTVNNPPNPKSANFAENVYEYHNGTVSLISDGRDTTPNSGAAGIGTSTRLLGASQSGHDVFLASNDQLTSQDTDTDRDYYDAHICEESSPCVAPPPSPGPGCSEEGCRGTAPGAPGASTPGSESFSGPGNLAAVTPTVPGKPKPLTRVQKLARALKACHRDKKKAKRVKCEKQARRQFGTAAKKARKSNHKRRTR